MGKFDLQKYISQSPLLEGINHIPNSEENGKTIYKSYLLEGLTKEEADSFSEKYKKRYAAILKSNPKFIKKYSNPDAVVHGMVVKEIVKLREKLNSSDPIEKYVDDFQNSDAKQFQNKSKSDINKMAQAAYFSKTKNEQMENPRLQELVKKALANPISEKVEFTDKHDDDKRLKGKQKDLPDNLQAKILNKEDVELTTKQKAVTAQNITGLPSFAQEILDYINKIEQIEGKGHINNGKIQNIITQLKTLTPKNKSLSERILKELRGSINEMAGEDLELKSLAKKFIPILKKYGMKVDYETDTKSIEMKPKVGPQGVPAKLLIRKQDDDKGGQFGMLTVAVYWLELVSAKKDRRLDLKELDFVPPSPETYDIADEMANKIYKELMAVVPKGEFDSITPPKMNRWGNYLIHFRLKK